MNTKSKLALTALAALFGTSVLAGCATDQTARDQAAAAMAAAERAQASADANEERVNRMYQKIMSK